MACQSICTGALRKGRGDIKDKPGAADFYYRVMELRRAHLAS
jgi:hypothetical protein